MKIILSILKSYRFYLIIALLVGIFIRFYGLDIQSLWFDELFVIFPATTKSTIMLKEIVFRDFHPPLYPLILYSWIGMFGGSEIMVRLPSAIAGALAPIFMYGISRKIFDKHIATSATILLAFSSAAIVYSQEARDYSFAVLFSTISTLLWLELLQSIRKSEINRKKLVIYGIIAVIATYSHYFAAALVFCQLLYLYFAASKLNKYKKETLILGIAVASVFSCWFLVRSGFYAKEIGSGNFWIEKGNFSYLIMLLDFVFNKKLIILLFIPIIMNAKNLWFKIKQLEIDSPIYALLFLSLFPVISIFLLNFVFPVFYPRYFIVILPAAYLLITILIENNPVFAGIKNNIYVFILCSISLLLFLFVRGNNVLDSVDSFYKPYKQQWREASKYVIENADNKSVIFCDRHPLMYLYYFKKFKRKDQTLYVDYYNAPVEKEKMREIRQKYNRLFAFSSFEPLPVEVEIPFRREFPKCKVKKYISLFVYDCSY